MLNVVRDETIFRKDFLDDGCVVLVDKPMNWTSFDVVNKIRFAAKRAMKTKKYKVGHAGTLDPLATGLLLVCLGKKYTKRIDEFVAQRKRYRAEITFGAQTPSYDKETLPSTYFPTVNIEEETLALLHSRFSGEISQFPPMYSAIKIKGTPLYRLARRGQSIERQSRNVSIYDLSLSRIKSDVILADVVCSKGTYIRSLAHDMGLAIHSGAYLSGLRRTAIGDYSVDNAVSIDQIVRSLDELSESSS